jgi:hypothetical protein
MERREWGEFPQGNSVGLIWSGGCRSIWDWPLFYKCFIFLLWRICWKIVILGRFFRHSFNFKGLEKVYELADLAGKSSVCWIFTPGCSRLDSLADSVHTVTVGIGSGFGGHRNLNFSHRDKSYRTLPLSGVLLGGRLPFLGDV